MDISGRITHVEFEPKNYFRVSGMVNSRFNENRMWGAESSDGFSMGWYWYDSMPPEVLKAFKRIISVIDAELQQRGILPKRWPTNLTDGADEADGADIFKFRVTKYKLANPVWLSKGDRAHTVTINASSEFFTDENDIVKEVILTHTHEEELKGLFTALENNL